MRRLASGLTRPDRPEHHFRYDPDKAVAYTATTVVSVGDPAAEGYAREIIRRLGAGSDPGSRPRRVASAAIDLSPALLVNDGADEACGHTVHAIASGRVVPSHLWRAAEVVRAVEERGLPEAAESREAHEEMAKQ